MQAGELARRLRMGSPSVVGRVREESLFLDLRSLLPADDDALLLALQRALGQEDA